MRATGTISLLAGSAAVLSIAGAGMALAMLDREGVSPGALAYHLGTDGDDTTRLAQRVLIQLERPALESVDLNQISLGGRATAPPALREVAAANIEALRGAMAQAMPGDRITLAAGVWRIGETPLAASRPGTASASIVVRGASGARIEVDGSQGFVVAAPFWRFERLAIRGVCARHSDCEHAFHVVGNADHFSAQDNVISDFNAHFKINGAGKRFPDDGNIEGNRLTNSTPRRTALPVTPIDLVGASRWTIRRNLIADFIKEGGDYTSYGAFAKGAGAHNVFEQNIIWCERLLRGLPGLRVGLSLGGGGTEARYCRDGKCIAEQEDSTVAANLVASCSADGIYLNSAARSVVRHNTLVGTSGIALRYPTTSAEVEGNLMDAPVRARDGAIARADDNRTAALAWRYLGYRALGETLGAGMAWRGAVPRRASASVAPPDLCGSARPATPAYGAFEDFSACRTGSR